MSDATLNKTYDASAVEARWYRYWEESGLFAPQPGEGKNPYCIMIPPPNVTGTLHMGHAFQDTLMDALIRYHRMAGHQTLWQTGTDHAGIATQMVVERQLQAEGKSRHDLGRERFIERVWQWRATSGGTIVQQLRRMGASCDWSRERFTMDDGLSQAVTEVFVRLHEEGLIYRGLRLVNWDPVLQTAVSDLEVVSLEEDGHFWHMRYPLADGSGHLVVATTRPETMLGDTAVAVHPNDPRFTHLVGQEVELPLTGRRIPIIADDYVDPEFGTGCVKITPAHDFNDHEVGKRHHLPMINVLTGDARINGNAPEKYQGLDRYEARKQVVADLSALGLLEKVEPHRHMVPRGDRSKAVIEPFLTDQWFVHTEPLAKEAIAAVESGRIRFVPENWSKTYFEWMRNIQDWCISRQIWWGHRIPAWYGPDGHVFVARDERDALSQAAAHYGQETALTQDEDVLDTWFSSALWTFSTLGWPQETDALKTFHPTSVLVTGFDIIFFWVARMIMMGLKFTGQVPFHEVYVHGLIRDGEGQKMSKSKGNVLDPLDLVDGISLEALLEKRTQDMMQPEKAQAITAQTRREFPDGIPPFGTDALRFTLAALATQGRDIKFDLKRIEGYRNFCNKLWNAARFVLMNTEGADCGLAGGDMEFSTADRWILTHLERLKADMQGYFAHYRFSDMANALYHFLWGSYCDWYVEAVKPTLYGEGISPAAQRGTRRVMVTVLEESLRLLHPVMPYITEELWTRVGPLAGVSGPSLMVQPWPSLEPGRMDEQAEGDMIWAMSFITAVRNIRGEMGIHPGKPLLLLVDGDEEAMAVLERQQGLILPLARLADWETLTGDPPSDCATGVVEGMRLFIPLRGLVDVEAEVARLEKEVARLTSELEKSRKKLHNPNFMERAKPEAIAKEQAKESQMSEKEMELTQALRRFQDIRGAS